MLYVFFPLLLLPLLLLLLPFTTIYVYFDATFLY
jgi:hypothetical protein